MERILVIGSGGAGKSTFSRRLSELTGIEAIHLDMLYWRPGWKEPESSEWEKIVDRIVQKKRWILDGNFGGTLDRRFEACDTVVLLDISRYICLYRVLKRRLKYRNRSRPDMTEGCIEQIDLEFLNWIWTYPRKKRPAVLKRLESAKADKNIFRLRTPAEVNAFLANVRSKKR